MSLECQKTYFVSVSKRYELFQIIFYSFFDNVNCLPENTPLISHPLETLEPVNAWSKYEVNGNYGC